MSPTPPSSRARWLADGGCRGWAGGCSRWHPHNDDSTAAATAAALFFQLALGTIDPTLKAFLGEGVCFASRQPSACKIAVELTAQVRAHVVPRAARALRSQCGH